MTTLILIANFLCSADATAQKQNFTALFFEKSELQLETRGQCREIKAALTDALNEPPEKLKAKRYQDYQGHPGQWTFGELIKHYFVSPSEAPFDELSFYRGLASSQAKKSIKKILKHLGDCQTYASE